MYICPVCKKRLKRLGSSYHCQNRHNFDIAGKGYVNLLTTAGRNPKNAGDNADMVKARTEFLDKGFYKPLAEKICEVTQAQLGDKKSPLIIDSGCGEGYYTAFLAGIKNARIFGIDISKQAVAHCMTRVHTSGITNCEFAVASSFELPFGSQSAHVVISVFAPVCNDEYARVLKADGVLIVVSPSARHLFELKAAVYDKPYENKPNRYGLNKFELAHETVFEYQAHIPTNNDIQSLFMMTPYSYKTSKEGMTRLAAVESLDVTCGFVIQVYRLIK